MAANLTDEGLHRQVYLGVLAQVGLSGEARSTLWTHMRLGLIKGRVPSVS